MVNDVTLARPGCVAGGGARVSAFKCSPGGPMSGDVAELRSRIVRAVLLNEHGFAPFTSLKTSTPPLRAEAHWLSVFVPKGTLFVEHGCDKA